MLHCSSEKVSANSEEPRGKIPVKSPALSISGQSLVPLLGSVTGWRDPGLSVNKVA